jgi:hypothetical protein
MLIAKGVQFFWREFLHLSILDSGTVFLHLTPNEDPEKPPPSRGYSGSATKRSMPRAAFTA